MHHTVDVDIVSSNLTGHPNIEAWCNGSTPTNEVGVVAIDAREESHGVTLLKYPETSIIGDGCLFGSNATRLKNTQSALWNSLVTVEVRFLLLRQINKSIMMTLDEAIQHAKEVASQCSDKECSMEYIQLAGWLEELKQRRLKDEREIQIVSAG